jgi:hypothetical protein
MYSCVVKNFHTTSSDRIVTNIEGKHKPGKSNDDVKKIYFKFQNCPYFPRNIGAHFKNLEIYYIMKSNLQHLLPGDLDGLDKLKNLDVSHNPIEEVKKDVFKNHDTLESVSFFDCHIKKVEKDTFDLMKNLKKAVFKYNDCLDDTYNSQEALIAEVYDKCDGKGYYVKKHWHCNDDESQNNNTFIIIGTVFITFLLVTIIALCLVMLRIYQTYFRSNWHEMKSTLI